MSNLSVVGVKVRQDSEGRYSLNDLHKAAVEQGANKRTKEPSAFLANKQTADFLRLLSDNSSSLPIATFEGRNGGTYATKAVAIEYYRWIFGAQAAAKLCEKITDLDALIEALDSFEVPDDLPDMYVYAIREAETGRVKLGISKDPESRLKQLQTGNSQQLELVAYKKAENRYQDEKELHLLHSEKNVRGEWFASSVCL